MTLTVVFFLFFFARGRDNEPQSPARCDELPIIALRISVQPVLVPYRFGVRSFGGRQKERFLPSTIYIIHFHQTFPDPCSYIHRQASPSPCNNPKASQGK